MLLLLLLSRRLEVNDHAAACQEVVEFAKTDEHGAALGPRGAVGGTGIPRQGEVVAAGHHNTAVIDDALTILLVEEKSPSIQIDN